MSSEKPVVGYCTNVHAGTSLHEMVANLTQYSVAVREHLGMERLPIGLWLPEPAAQELCDSNGVHELRTQLNELGLSVFTLNGFPQGNFHAEVVKHNVYKPDWQTPERTAYTIQLAKILVDLLPDDLHEGSISTLPLGWRTDFPQYGTAIENLTLIAHAFAELEEQSGKLIHLDIEPEPGCALDTCDDVIALFEQLPESSRRYLRVCHDVCHSAVMFEPQSKAINTYRNAGIAIGKIQISACPEVNFDLLDSEQCVHALERLRSFQEPRYLHQVCVQTSDGAQTFFEDLPTALDQHEPQGCWRVHFHVPVFADELDGIVSTQQQIAECLVALDGNYPVLEVETYAWNVLPEGLFNGDLAAGIAEELRWTHSQLPE